MKVIAFIAAIAALSYSTFAELPGATAPTATPAATVDELKTVPTVSVYQMSQKWADYEGKVVKLKFDARFGDAAKDGESMRGGVVSAPVNGTSALISLVFPAAQEKWFTRIPRADNTFNVAHGGGHVIYARISKGSNGMATHTATALGKEIKNTPRGPELAWSGQ